MTRVLLVDDDLELGEMLTDYLDREGFATTAVQDGETGVREALAGGYGLVVLDVMMPGLSGIDTLGRIEREAGRLDQLVGELLTLSRMEAGMARAADEEIDLVELVRAVVRDAGFEAQATGRRVAFVGAGETVGIANAELLHRALENVVRNAVKFTPVGTAVEVAIARDTDPSRLTLTVADRGPGVPEGELEAIFAPFFRGETRAKTAGFGLGLAIARRAIEGHGGGICARNRPGGGLVVEIVLPVVTGG